MVSTGKTLAKVSSPKLSGIVPRKRLFNLLDEALEHPMVLGVCTTRRGQNGARGQLSHGEETAKYLVSRRCRRSGPCNAVSLFGPCRCIA